MIMVIHGDLFKHRKKISMVKLFNVQGTVLFTLKEELKEMEILFIQQILHLELSLLQEIMVII